MNCKKRHSCSFIFRDVKKLVCRQMRDDEKLFYLKSVRFWFSSNEVSLILRIQCDRKDGNKNEEEYWPEEGHTNSVIMHTHTYKHTPHIHTHVHTRTHTHTHTHTQTHTHTLSLSHTHTSEQTHTIHTHVYTHTQTKNTLTCINKKFCHFI